MNTSNVNKPIRPTFGTGLATELRFIPQEIRNIYREVNRSGTRSPLPHNFFNINETAWRSAKPSFFEIETLGRLETKFTTMIDVGNPSQSEFAKRRQFAAEHGIEYHNIKLTSHSNPEERQIGELFDIIDNAQGKSIIHCWKGINRTGFMSAFVRLRDGNPLEEVIQELLAIGHNHSKYPNLINFMVDNYQRIIEKYKK